MSYEYIYSIKDDFPNSKVNIEALAYEIRESAITIALDYILNQDEIECHVYMKAMLAEEEHALLDELIAAHQGEALVGTQTVAGAELTQIVNSNMTPVDVDSEGRMKVLSFVTPKEHELSGHQHIGQLADEQLPDCVARCTDIVALSGTLTQGMYDFAEQYYDKPEMDDLLLTKSPISHQHDLRYYKRPEVDALIITEHANLNGLGNDDHPQYLNTVRGDARYLEKSVANTISGTLQVQLDSKSLSYLPNQILHIITLMPA